MKLRLIDRILVAVTGLILVAMGVWVALDALGAVMPLSEVLAWLLNVDSLQKGVLVACLCAALALLGGYDIAMALRRKKGKRGFIAQKSENGEISISIKSIEGLVFKCAQKHGEIRVQSVAVEEMRDGLLIKLRAALPSGMNIPLAVGTLQKQVKQYITACSGIDVREVQVKVESTDKAADGSPYAVSEAAVTPYVEEPEPVPIPAEAVAPVELPEERPEPEIAEPEERPTHQRIFSPVEEPAIVPEPPAISLEEIEAEVQQAVADEVEPETEPAIPSEEEIEAEAQQAVADAGEPETDWIERNESGWDAAAGEAEASAEQWEAAETGLTEPEADDEEEKTEE